MGFSTTALNAMLDSMTVGTAKLHNGDPGAAVRQRVKGGVHNCQYKIVCTATNGVDTFVQAAQLRVRSV
jgi:hypothetical protein